MDPYLERLLAEPESESAWGAYAEGLRRSGDPRGRAIALEEQRRGGDPSPDLELELASLYGAIATDAGLGPEAIPGWKLAWEGGFVDRARYVNDLSHRWYEHPDPVPEIEAIRRVLCHPASQLVRRLEVQFDDFCDTPDDAARAVAHLRRGRLRTAHFGLTERALARQAVGQDPSEGVLVSEETSLLLMPALPALDELGLVGASLFCPAFHHQGVTHFATACASVAALQCTWFDGGAEHPPFPEARTLSLAYVDDSGHGEDMPISEVTSGVRPEFFPAVRELDLTRSGLWDEQLEGGHVAALASAPIVRQLASLAARAWLFGTAAPAALDGAAESLRHLRRLALCEPRGPEEALERVRRHLGIDVVIVERPPFVVFPAFPEDTLPAHRLDFRERRYEAGRANDDDDDDR